eukprot:CAMPEP_0194443274 /NCGR_PEP_ID=MMETSP0176-20130528/126610_1 /TAXON_ID=216777 /ORGANISM="Proboscia alata, Strain PI-D3" /LENGTH=508 /DNA_ID=CAMNT_0039269499 /DNA_START=30 /DNA_END=1554 /DNA_ORIENTATION=-
MTTSQATASYLPSSLSTISPSLKLAPSTALNQMPCPTTVRNLPLPRDTPGPSPDETGKRKSYAAALLSEAARPTSGPLGQHDAAWPPLASMATDPPPKQFVLAKDPVPPDRPKLFETRAFYSAESDALPYHRSEPTTSGDTPGPSPDETGKRKSYAAALLSEAARPTSGPLGQHDAAWPPLASMATDPPPKQFVLAKDPVPPDRPKLKNKRRRRPRTRRHRKPPRDNQHTTDSPLKSETNLIAVLSSLVSDIQTQSLVELNEIFATRIKNLKNEIITNLKNALRFAIKKLRTKLRASDIQTQSLVELNEIFATRIKNLKNEIITNLKNALRFAIKKLRAKLRAEITFMQEQHEQKHSKSSKQQTKKWPILHPPRTHKSDYVLKTCTSTDDDESVFSDQDGAQKNLKILRKNLNQVVDPLVATRRDLASDGVDERCIHEGPLVATRQFDGVDERPVRELATNNFFDCHLVEVENIEVVENASVEPYSDGEQDDGGTSDGGWSASGASAQ